MPICTNVRTTSNNETNVTEGLVFEPDHFIHMLVAGWSRGRRAAKIRAPPKVTAACRLTEGLIWKTGKMRHFSKKIRRQAAIWWWYRYDDDQIVIAIQLLPSSDFSLLDGLLSKLTENVEQLTARFCNDERTSSYLCCLSFI